LFLRDVDLRASLVPVGPDLVDLKVRVSARPAAPMGLIAQIDNHGLRTYGEERYTMGVSVAGSIRPGDQLDALLIHSARMDYGSLNYDLPLQQLGARLNVSGALVGYRVPSAGQKGRTSLLGAGLSFPLHVGERSVRMAYLSVQHREQTDRLHVFGRIADKTATSLQAKLDFRYFPEPSQTLYFTPAWTVGYLDLSGLASAQAQDQASARTQGHYAKFEWDAGWSMLFGEVDRFDARVDVKGQMASKNLDQSEKFSLGGPVGLRAFGPAEGLGDHGVLANAELGYRPVQGLRVFAFYGMGRIHRYDTPWAVEPVPDRYSLRAAGVGLSLSFKALIASLTYARSINGNPGRSPGGLDSEGLRRDDRLWLSLTLRQ
jgi:hemolysin activation/secretion protein